MSIIGWGLGIGGWDPRERGVDPAHSLINPIPTELHLCPTFLQRGVESCPRSVTFVKDCETAVLKSLTTLPKAPREREAPSNQLEPAGPIMLRRGETRKREGTATGQEVEREKGIENLNIVGVPLESYLLPFKSSNRISLMKQD